MTYEIFNSWYNTREIRSRTYVYDIVRYALAIRLDTNCPNVPPEAVEEILNVPIGKKQHLAKCVYITRMS